MSEVTRAEFEELKQVVEAQSERIAELERRNRELVDALEDATIIDEGDDGEQDDEDHEYLDENLHERVADLEKKTDLHFQDICDLEVDTRELEDRVSAIEDGDGQSSDGGNGDAGPSIEPQTPLENLASLPPESTKDQRANVRRALFVARDVLQYTKKVPKGRAITWSELQTVIYAGTDASHAEDVSRTMEVLATFGQDWVEMVDRPDRPKLVCFDEEAATRLDRLCSDVDPTNDVVSRAKG